MKLDETNLRTIFQPTINELTSAVVDDVLGVDMTVGGLRKGEGGVFGDKNSGDFAVGRREELDTSLANCRRAANIDGWRGEGSDGVLLPGWELLSPLRGASGTTSPRMSISKALIVCVSSTSSGSLSPSTPPESVHFRQQFAVPYCLHKKMGLSAWKRVRI